MLDFIKKIDQKTHKSYIETSISGKQLLSTPQLNKGTAFTQAERADFGILGKLPHKIESLEEQVTRAYLQLKSYTTAIQKNIYLNNLHDKNQIIFYALIRQHLLELIPIIYTPTVGLAVKAFSHEYRQPRGLYISHTYQDNLEVILNNRSNPNIDLIVVTDGERVLGIGDQGIGGMDIPVAKLMVYSACGGIDPTRTLPIFLDVGTNNIELLADPFYLGCRHNRIFSNEYDKFLDKFIDVLHKNFPHAFLHWEDFGQSNARRLLDKYADKMCSFNDDIQGTGATTLAALLTAVKVTAIPFTENRIIVYGAGSAGTGIADQIVEGLTRMGLSLKEAYKCFWLVDRQGLLIDSDETLTPEQRPYARKPKELNDWDLEVNGKVTLLDTVRAIKPTVLIGCSAQPGHFTQEIITLMANSIERPVIFPLSNPDDKCEATPFDILTWTKGRALVATGTAFDMVKIENRIFTIAQCNNALIFPGIGLGVIISKARKLNNDMLWAAAIALSKLSPSLEDDFLPLLPSMDIAETISKQVALAVAQTAIESGVAPKQTYKNLKSKIDENYWTPHYLPFIKAKSKNITTP